jgi:hypothetical protein
MWGATDSRENTVSVLLNPIVAVETLLFMKPLFSNGWCIVYYLEVIASNESTCQNNNILERRVAPIPMVEHYFFLKVETA